LVTAHVAEGFRLVSISKPSSGPGIPSFVRPDCVVVTLALEFLPHVRIGMPVIFYNN
jgi:hypothetical protein